MSNSIIKNSAFSILKTFSTILFPIITFSYSSRIFLADGMGRISFAKSLVEIFTMIAMLGIRYYGIRECSKRRDNKELLSKTFSELLILNLISTFLTYFILFAFIRISHKTHEYKVEIWIYSISIILTAIGVEWLFTGMEDYKYLAQRSIFVQAASLIAVLLFVHHKEDIFIYLIIQVVANCGVNIVGLFYAGRYVTFVFPEWRSLIYHIKPVFRLFFVTMFIQVFTEMDTVMLGYLSGNYETGLYFSAYKISTVLCAVIAAATTVIMPKMAYVFQCGDDAKANDLLKKTIQFILLVGVPLSVGAGVYSRDFILLLSGESFIKATNSSVILSARTLISPINGTILLHYLIPRNNDKEAIFVTAIAATFNVAMNACMIPIYGAIGASVATVCAEVVEFCAIVIFTRKYLDISEIFLKSYHYFVGAIPVLIVSTIAERCINNSVFAIAVGIVFSVPVYFGILKLLNNQYVNLMVQLLYKVCIKIIKMS